MSCNDFKLCNKKKMVSKTNNFLDNLLLKGSYSIVIYLHKKPVNGFTYRFRFHDYFTKPRTITIYFSTI